MLSSELFTLSKHELLEMEGICDGYESDQKLSESQMPLDVDPYVQRASASIQPFVLAELARIQTEWNMESATQRMADSTAHGNQFIGNAKADGIHSQIFLQSQLGRRFSLIEFLGQGCSGSVWKAFDQQLNRLVAIKVPHPNMHSTADHFLREARAASRLNHPNIVRILEVGQEQETCFLLSELIDGVTLAKRLESEQLTIDESVDLLIEIAQAMEYAHSMGIVHRDLKPHNILIGKNGTIKIVDFGLAKDWNDKDATLTQTGSVIGTPAYMSPEQANGGDSNPKSTTDIYSFGVVFFQLLTGDVPFRGNTRIVLFQVLHADPPSPIRMDRNLPVELNTLCLKCLEKDPTERFQTAKELKDELVRFRSGHPIHSKPASNWVIAKKWIGRNRRLSGWIASTILLLIATTLVASIAAVVVARSWSGERDARLAAHSALNEAQNQTEEANKQSQANNEIVRSLESIFLSTNPLCFLLTNSDGSTVEPPSLNSMLDGSVDRFRSELANQPAVQAKLFDAIANAYRATGEFRKSQELLNEATRIREQSDSKILDRWTSSRDSMVNKFYRGWLAHDRSQLGEAEKFYRAALDGFPKEDNSEDQLFLADVQFHLGRSLIDLQRHDDAVPLMREALRIRERLLPSESLAVQVAKFGLIFSKKKNIENLTLSDFNDVNIDILAGKGWEAEIIRNYFIGWNLRQAKDYVNARRNYELVLHNLGKVLPAKNQYALLVRGDYAGLLYESGDYRTVFPIVKELINDGNAICPEHTKLVDVKLQFASELMRASKIDEARKLYEEAMAQQIARGDFPEEAHYGLTWCLLDSKSPEAALAHAEALWGHRDRKTAYQVAWCAHTRARALQACGIDDEAKTMDERAMKEAVIELHFPKDAISLERLSAIHTHKGDLATAERLLRDAVNAERHDRPAKHPRLADRILSLAQNLMAQKKTDEARKMFTESLAIYQQSLPLDDVRIEDNIRVLQTLDIH